MALALVTLTTDFGTADGYVGAVKGVLHRLAPGVTVVDITHDVPRHDIAAGAHVLATAAPWFPAGTVHVAVVDPGVGGARRGVVVAAGGQVFVGPDNGIFDLAAPLPSAVHEIAAAGFRADRVSSTFHGRDVFAVAAARLAAGAPPERAGPAVALTGRLPGAGAAGAAGAHRVVHVDVFGNLVTDVDGGAVPAGSRVRVAGREVGPLRATFEDVARGEVLAYVGSGGTVEIAVREGSAAELLGAGRGAPVEVIGP
ncbi:MAG TPA: SAM-dependent chlorinase/fluorinase [Kofleriaceae bacterium]|nr:SAM-dependent chlorinase/fluorinase [Kofleriaceae bacterium]